jgi:hypothetical protein
MRRVRSVVVDSVLDTVPLLEVWGTAVDCVDITFAGQH